MMVIARNDTRAGQIFHRKTKKARRPIAGRRFPSQLRPS
jgi:hypothetical protein